MSWEPIPGENPRMALRAKAYDGSNIDALVMRRQRNAGVWKWMLRINGEVKLRFIHGKDDAVTVAEFLMEEREKGPDAYGKALSTAEIAVRNGTVQSSLLAARSGFSRS